MKINLNVAVLVALFFGISAAEASRQPKACAIGLVAVSDSKGMTNLKWRQSISYTLPGSKFTPTSKARETEIKDDVDFMVDEVYVEESTPMVDFFPIKGIKLKDTGKGVTDGYGTAWDYKVTGLTSTKGILYGTILLPVSGHLGASSAKRWAANDTLNLSYVDSSGKEHPILAHVRSKGPVTIAEIAIPLEAGKSVRVQYYRDGSAGVGGYSSGRIIDFHWDGK